MCINACLCTRAHLELGDKGIQTRDGGSGGAGALILLLQPSGHVGGLNGLEELFGGLLLLKGGGKATDGSAGLVHVTVELTSNIGPLLLGNVAVKLLQAVLGLDKDLLLAVSVCGVLGVVHGVGSVTVDRVRGVDLGRLVGTVGGTL